MHADDDKQEQSDGKYERKDMADCEGEQGEGDDDGVLCDLGDFDAANLDRLRLEDVKEEGNAEDGGEGEDAREVAQGEDGGEGEGEDEVVVEVGLDVRREAQVQLGGRREGERGRGEEVRPGARRLQDELETVLRAQVRGRVDGVQVEVQRGRRREGGGGRGQSREGAAFRRGDGGVAARLDLLVVDWHFGRTGAGAGAGVGAGVGVSAGAGAGAGTKTKMRKRSGERAGGRRAGSGCAR